MKSEYIKLVGYEELVILMDDQLREQLHEKLAPCTDLEFLKNYIVEHKKKFGEDFIITGGVCV